jgi:undecaprenyl-diphosphatase
MLARPASSADTPSRRLRRVGWLYIVGFLVAAGALLGFAKLAEEVLQGQTRAINTAVLETLHAHANPVLDRLALTFTHLGGVGGTVIVACLTIAWFLGRHRTLDAFILAIVLLGGLLLVVVLKNSFRQERPALFDSLAPERGFSFPSGHSLMSLCLYGYLAMVLLLEGGHAWRWAVALLLLLLPVTIAWSRLYLGVHWLSDVAAGGLAACFWVACCLLGRQFVLGRLHLPLAVDRALGEES